MVSVCVYGMCVVYRKLSIKVVIYLDMQWWTSSKNNYASTGENSDDSPIYVVDFHVR